MRIATIQDVKLSSEMERSLWCVAEDDPDVSFVSAMRMESISDSFLHRKNAQAMMVREEITAPDRGLALRDHLYCRSNQWSVPDFSMAMLSLAFASLKQNSSPTHLPLQLRTHQMGRPMAALQAAAPL